MTGLKQLISKRWRDRRDDSDYHSEHYNTRTKLRKSLKTNANMHGSLLILLQSPVNPTCIYVTPQHNSVEHSLNMLKQQYRTSMLQYVAAFLLMHFYSAHLLVSYLLQRLFWIKRRGLDQTPSAFTLKLRRLYEAGVKSGSALNRENTVSSSTTAKFQFISVFIAHGSFVFQKLFDEANVALS